MGTGDRNVPADILTAAEAAPHLLDEDVHAAKGSEAADSNNSGASAQIEYLQEGGMTWSHFRVLLHLEDPEDE